MKHLDETTTLSTSGVQYNPSKKYTLAVFLESIMHSIKDICKCIYPHLAEDQEFHFPSTFKKMNYQGQEYCAKQYIHAKSVFPLLNINANIILFYVQHWYIIFGVHILTCFITHPFVYVSWHPLQHSIGKPYHTVCLEIALSTLLFH